MTLYGDCKTVPTPETEPCRPDSYYGITKHAAERYVHATAERPDLGFDFSVTSLRMFSVYGPGQSFNNPYQGVLGIFSGNLLRGEPITIFGDGEQTRDFVYIDDIVDGWVRALEYTRIARRHHQPGQRPVAVDQRARRRTSSRHSAIRPAATQIDPRARPAGRAARRAGRHSPGAGGPRLGAADAVRDRARANRRLGPQTSSPPIRPLQACGGSCAMKLLLVDAVDPWTRSVSTVHKWVAGRPGAGARGRRLRRAACRSCRRCPSRPT